jgi:uncharacterized protein YndB with AHSA1/START domain
MIESTDGLLSSNCSSTLPNTPGAAHTVQIEKHIAARPEFVFRCFTEPRLLSQWWAARTDANVSAQIQLEVGGEFRISYQTRDGNTRVTTGRYTEITRAQRLSFTWKWGELNSHAEQTNVSIEFIADGHHTKIKLTHGQFDTSSDCAAHKAGWSASLSFMDDVTKQRQNNNPEV